MMILEDKETIVRNPEEDWSPTKDKAALANAKALNAIYSGVDKNVFKLVKTRVSAKEIWEILETSYEGTSKVQES